MILNSVEQGIRMGLKPKFFFCHSYPLAQANGNRNFFMLFYIEVDFSQRFSFCKKQLDFSLIKAQKVYF